MLKKLFVFVLVIILNACSSTKNNEKNIKNFETKYNEALLELKNKNFSISAEKFENLILNSEDTEGKTIILSAFAYYKAKKYDLSLNLIDVFEKEFPLNNNIVYMNYLKILNNFDKIKYVGRNTDIAKKTYDLCNNFLNKYKDNIYTEDIITKKEIMKNYVVANEMMVVRYNLSKSNFIPALERLDNIKNNYDNSLFRDEVYFRYMEIYKYIGHEYKNLINEIKDTKWLELAKNL